MSIRPGPDAMPGEEAWVREHGGSVLRHARFCTGNNKLAEEIAQDALVKIHIAWADPEKRDKILNKPGYVRTIVRNCFLDYIAVPSRTSDREVQFDAERHDRTISEETQDLRLAVLQLDDDEQDLIFLHYYQDLTIKDAGIELGISQSQAYRLRDSALAHLKRLLLHEGES